MQPKNISRLAMKKVFKSQGALRISEDSVNQLQKEIEQKIKTVSSLAKKYARHANRKTILDSDIELALRELEK